MHVLHMMYTLYHHVVAATAQLTNTLDIMPCRSKGLHHHVLLLKTIRVLTEGLHFGTCGPKYARMIRVRLSTEAWPSIQILHVQTCIHTYRHHGALKDRQQTLLHSCYTASLYARLTVQECLTMRSNKYKVTMTMSVTGCNKTGQAAATLSNMRLSCLSVHPDATTCTAAGPPRHTRTSRKNRYPSEADSAG